MSAQRFIRCKHCGMPHEARATSCPITGQALVPEKRRASVAPPAPTAPAPESYQWAHSIHPYSIDPSSASSDGDGVRHRDASALIGRVIEGKYRIEALIGRGGMGAVYRAENVRIGRHVAIKILLAGHAPGSESERRFLREARIAGSIGHPNICEVIDLGTLDDGAPFQVMELLEGQSLAQRIRLEGAMPIDEVLTISEQVLSALSAAHGRGIVHRDLKPDNVFLHVLLHHGAHPDDDESPTHAKLLDFGVSKSLFHDHTLSLTQTGMVVGTPYYLAPEQARGDRGVDHRVDLWAMGVVMYEALTGMLPFRAENYNALIVKILQTRPALPSTIRPQLPAEIEAIVMRALAYAPADRFSSADDMLAALRAARGRRGSSPERAALRDRGGRDALLAQPPLESTLSDLRISVVQGPEDPTEISETFVYSEVEATRKKG